MKLKVPQIAKIAARTYFKVFDNITEGWEEAEDCDAGFDHGEYSTMAWDKNWQEAESRAMEIVWDNFIHLNLSMNDFRHALAHMIHAPMYHE